MVILLAATTNDGYIARSKTDKSFDWTSHEDKSQYISELKQADFIVIGSTSFKTFSRYPKGSKWIILTNQSSENIHPLARPLDSLHVKSSELEAQSTQFYTTNLPPKALMNQLTALLPNCLVAICGGQSIYTQFAQDNLIDEFHITVETKAIFNTGISLFFNPQILPNLNLVKEISLSPTTIQKIYRPKTNN